MNPQIASTHFDEHDFVKRGIDLRHLRRPSPAVSGRRSGRATSRTISAAIPGICDHAIAARTSTRLATPPSRPPDHLKTAPEMYRKTTPSAAWNATLNGDPQRPQHRQIGGSVHRLRPLARQRADRRPDRRQRDYVARRIGIDDAPNRRARFSPDREERCDRAASPVRHRSPRPAANFATLAPRPIAQ